MAILVIETQTPCLGGRMAKEYQAYLMDMETVEIGRTVLFHR
jgi:hypothetical protein